MAFAVNKVDAQPQHSNSIFTIINVIMKGALV